MTQSYSIIRKTLRRQAKAVFLWYPKERADLKMILDENHLLGDDELAIVRDFLRASKYACLYIRNEHPRQFEVLSHKQGDHFLREPIDSLEVGVVTSFMYFCGEPGHLSFCHKSYSPLILQSYPSVSLFLLQEQPDLKQVKMLAD